MGSYIRLPTRAECGVGQAFVDIHVVNGRDRILAESGVLPESQVRRRQVPQVLVDTGATTLSLPTSLIAELGLPLKHKILVTTANGDVESGLYWMAELTVSGRTGMVDCVALPEGLPALLGVVPLEMLGLQPDLRTHTLRTLPDDTRETYIHI